VRIQLDLDEKGLQLLDNLKSVMGVKTHKELFNNAVTLLDWAVRQRSNGYAIAALDEQNKTFRELQMPALEHVAPAVKSHTAER
jgi:hypothetical protein